jgi:hypothetical protein
MGRIHTRISPEVVLSVIGRVARFEIRKEFLIDSCIGSTRIIIKVLKRYGIKGIGLAVRTVVFSDSGGAVLGVSDWGPPAKRGLWRGTCAGHAVAVIPDRNILIDASLDQLNLPKYGISNLPCPLIAQVSADFIACREVAFLYVDGNRISYAPEPLPEAVRKSNDWSNETWHRNIVNAICNRIDSTLGYPKYDAATAFKERVDGLAKLKTA